jgi:HemY protein
MRRILVLTTLLLVATVAALELRGQSGYILLRIAGYSVETSPSFALIAVLALFWAVQFALHLLLRFIHSPRDLKRWNRQQQRRRSQRQLNQGLITLAEGEWEKAELLLSRSASHSETPLMHYLGAANAAQHLHAEERCEHYLQQARERAPKGDFVIRLTQAEQLVAQQQYGEALELLNRLKDERPKQQKVLQLLVHALGELGHWDTVLELLPRLRRQHTFGSEALNQLELQAETRLLSQKAAQGGHGAVVKQWNRLSKKQRHNPILFYHYITLLLEVGSHQECELLLRKEIDHHWSEQLVTLYGSFTCDPLQQQIHTAERWLEQHDESAALHLTMGRLFLRNEVWGAAQHHLQRSIEIEPSSAAYQELAALMKQNQDLAAALHYFEQELALLREDGDTPSSSNNPLLHNSPAPPRTL